MVIINYIRPFVVVSASCLLTGSVEVYNDEALIAEKEFEKESMIQVEIPEHIEAHSIKVVVKYNNGKQVSKIIKMSSNLTSYK